MINIGFVPFLTLLVISLITALVMHYVVRYRVLDGADGFTLKWIAGWVMAWLASRVLGHWFAGVEIGTVYIIPAFIGGFIGAFAPPNLRARSRTGYLGARAEIVRRKHTMPEDYGAIYCQWADAIHKRTPDARLGGPVFEDVNKDITLWADDQGRTSWMGQFIDYLKATDIFRTSQRPNPP